jgi:hypothetical protein
MAPAANVSRKFLLIANIETRCFFEAFGSARKSGTPVSRLPDKTAGANGKRRRRAALQSGLPAAWLAREAPWSAERSSALAVKGAISPNLKSFVSQLGASHCAFSTLHFRRAVCRLVAGS